MSASAYCPSCGLSQPTQERTSGSLHQWLCATCGLVLREEIDLAMPEEEPAAGAAPAPGPAPGPALGRIPLQRMSPAELEGIKAAGKAAAQKAAAQKAALRAAAQARAAPGQRNTVEPIELPPEDDVPEADLLEPAPDAGSAGPVFERVIITEDTALLRQIVTDALICEGVSQQVRGCANGEEFLVAVGESFATRSPPNLVILDVEMPIVNGYQAAIALRAFERGFRAPPTPIVFFTAHPCDETFKRVLEHCQPARYLNKGADSSPPRIASRLVQVLASLLRS